MSARTLQDAIDQAGSPVKLLRDTRHGAETGPITGGEFSNWHDEQLSWRQTAGLFDLSHHMTDLTVRGPDALSLITSLGVNSLAVFPVGRAKQIVCVNEDGKIIGDAILDHVDVDTFRVIGTPAVPDWILFHIRTGDHDVTWSWDEPSASNPLGHPELYRYQVNGPRATDILQKVTGRPVPEIKFFTAGSLRIDGREVRALAHSMSRAQGLELIGPWAEAQQIREALLEAGQEFGLTPIGSRAPTAATLESGWLPAPLPAIYSGDGAKAYREYLPADGWAGSGSLGGSLISDEISDYYLAPSDVGYGRLVKFDHDFVGREALENGPDRPARRKATLVWNTDDVVGVFASGFGAGTPGKYLDFPLVTYSTWQYDKLLLGDRVVGISTMGGFTNNERKLLSLGVVDDTIPEGTEVTLVWGEPDGGSAKPQVERHVQTPIRAVVGPVPYSKVDHA